MKHALFFLFTLTVLLFSTGCTKESDKDNPTPELSAFNLQFDLSYQGQPLVMFEPYSLNDSVRVLFSRFSMYLTDIELINSEGSTVSLEELGFYNLTDQFMDEVSAAEGYSLNFPDLEPGTFSGLRFGLGLPQALNVQQPGDFEPGHPLNAPEEYWIGWQSYVFVKIEGKIDADSNPNEFERNMALHLGGDEIFRQVQLNEPIVLNSGLSTTLVINIDLYDMFSPEGSTSYDLLDRPMIHSTSHLPQANELIDNLVGTIQ